MAKQKKITVKFYPVKVAGERKYSIYCRTTYNGKSTKFPINFSWGANSQEGIEEWIQKQLNNPIFHPRNCLLYTSPSPRDDR